MSTIEITSDHLIEGNQGFALAGNLRINDSVLRYKEGAFFDRIINIEKKVEQGFATPLTKSGTFIANGCVTSCYANTSHSLGQIASWPARNIPLVTNAGLNKEGMHRYFSFLTNVFSKVDIGIVKYS